MSRLADLAGRLGAKEKGKEGGSPLKLESASRYALNCTTDEVLEWRTKYLNKLS